MRVDPEKVDRVLVIGLSCLGDMLLASGALWNLRLFLPGAHFKIMVGPRAVEAVRHDPMWQEVEVYHRQRDYPGPWGRLKVISRIRAFRPDLIVDLRSGLNPLFSGARYAPLWGLKELRLPKTVHEAERNLICMASIGVPIRTRNMRFHISQAAEEAAERLVGEGRFVVLNPGGSFPPKRWPEENFARLALHLARMGLRVAVIGKLPDEVEMAQRILDGLGSAGIDLRSCPSLEVLGAVLRRASLMVSNDTGPVHLASAAGTPTVGLYSHKDLALRYGPWCTPHESLLPREGARSLEEAMGSIPVDDAIDAAERLLRGGFGGA